MWWGDKSGVKQNGIITYSTSTFDLLIAYLYAHDILLAISPFQAKAAPNMFRNYLFNGIRRLTSPAAIIFYIPLAIGVFTSVCLAVTSLTILVGYYTFNWANAKYEYLHSKAYHLEQLEKEGHNHE